MLAGTRRIARLPALPADEPISQRADADLERIRAFYADKRGYRPERAGEIRFRD